MYRANHTTEERGNAEVLHESCAEDFEPGARLCYRSAVASKNSGGQRFGRAAGAVLGLGLVWTIVPACASTEFFNEGPGQPSDRATGTVPPGSIGVCKRSGTRRPPLVSERLWEDARPCTGRTPASFIRLGYGHSSDGGDVETDAQMAKTMQIVAEAARGDAGRPAFTGMMRGLREQAAKDPWMRDRVFHPSATTGSCDIASLLATMQVERGKIDRGDRCAAYAYDSKLRGETCIFDAARDEVVWLTSAWSCVTHTGALGEAQSCYRLCAYDDYCARQVSCAAPDLDLLLCTLGVCLPEAREGFY